MERDRLRERERQARAAMSVQAEQAAAGGAPDARHGHHHGHHNHGHHADSHAATASLFRAPVKVGLSSQSFILLKQVIKLLFSIFLFVSFNEKPLSYFKIHFVFF